ncbi:ankyrin repeat domain-containing protein [Helicobacter muridarum]|uniref:Ankyrin repeat domain-containing protein n=1 Tax=Helicobacter muridarum TaxID=216 RepID=A0A377PVU0_9HELI|nr:ankyrin repeat domain-containing protein [Helicobacter muridarum]TLE00835.1 ankyrin repeat domain-containing protein [Helicobacter muridarum]STQ86599.1 ankyrin repeat-containing protein [Helicobacter muridarum]
MKNLKKALFVVLFGGFISSNQYDYLLFSHILTDVESGLELKADVNARIHGITPLYQAIATNQIEIAYILVVMGADVNAKVNGETPLHKAAQVGNPLMIELLINAGAQVNAQDEKYGNTPLHYAAINGDYQSINILTQNNANVMTPNFQGYNPAQIISSEIIIPPIILEDDNLAVSASSFKLGYGAVTFNVRNLTNRTLRIFYTGLYINGRLANSKHEMLVIPPGTTVTEVNTMTIPTVAPTFIKPSVDGLADIKVGFSIDYQAEGKMGQVFDSVEMKMRLWSSPTKNKQDNTTK